MEQGQQDILCYCAFCQTQHGNAVAQRISEQLRCRAFYPVQVQHTWKKGKAVDFEHPLTPGYVFFYAGEEPELALLHSISGFLKLLRYSDGEARLQGGDRQFALMLLERNGALGKTKVYQEGDRIRLKEGAFYGVESRILKVDRRNMRMQIELPFAGSTIKTWVEYETVEALD